jgi:hypothetical protein
VESTTCTCGFQTPSPWDFKGAALGYVLETTILSVHEGFAWLVAFAEGILFIGPEKIKISPIM